jgi:predicted nucleic acid-binding Zn ribbon protein
MRRRAPRPIADALAVVTARWAPATDLAAVQGVWADVVGTTIAAHATPVGERGGVLEVACDEAVWAAELELMGPALAERLSAALGRPAITGLRCRADPRPGR